MKAIHLILLSLILGRITTKAILNAKVQKRLTYKKYHSLPSNSICKVRAEKGGISGRQCMERLRGASVSLDLFQKHQRHFAYISFAFVPWLLMKLTTQP
jgi:hypothetical protein